MKDIRSNAHPDIKVILIGNKVDLEENRKISKEEGENLQKTNNLDLFMETSAKTGFNTKELFIEVGKMLYKNYKNYQKIKPRIVIKKRDHKKDRDDEGRSTCC